MAHETPWADLLDPDEPEIVKRTPRELHARALDELVRPGSEDEFVRPTIEGHGDYVLAVLLAPVAVVEEDRVYYQEIDFVLTEDELLTVRKTPVDGEPFDIRPIDAICEARHRIPPGMVAYHVVDELAERYLDLLDAVDEEIDELEEHVDDWDARKIQVRLSELRHDLLNFRRTLAPTRDAVRGVVDGRVDIEGRPLFRREVFPRDVELHFSDVHAKLLRASESLEFSRDLLSSVRDYHQTKISSDQNEVMKRLTALATVLLVPTFIVGLYGQNFRHMPELRWGYGYWWSWGLIIVSTVVQLVYYRRKGWL